MTAGEFNKRQLQKSIALLLEEEPKTQRERDIFNLKQIRYSIRHGSDWYRYGVIASLDRVIKMLEKDAHPYESETPHLIDVTDTFDATHHGITYILGFDVTEDDLTPKEKRLYEESKAYLAWKEGRLKGEDHGV